ncbi:MAG: hypothetical protein M1827_003789 [Pycnora praestabilis]|nr:MAG: hypothetical protein M1827_003789 [Pycnora praestabilis]
MGGHPPGWLSTNGMLWACFGLTVGVGLAAATSSSTVRSTLRPLATTLQTSGYKVLDYQHTTITFVHSQYLRARIRRLSLWDMVQVAALCGLVPGLWLFRKLHKEDDLRPKSLQQRQRETEANSSESTQEYTSTAGLEAVTSDPGLLKKHSSYKSYTVFTTNITYPSIRTFYRPHPQADKLPSKPYPIPLLVFIHGLGGSLAQFHPLLTTLVNLAPCLGIDLPGCGLSAFSPTDWQSYTTETLTELLATVIDKHRDAESGQPIVIVGHSMGCSLAALLASSTSPHRNRIAEHILGIVAVCPKSTPPSEEEVAKFRKLLRIPGPIFDLWRQWDRRGGSESASVKRFIGHGADKETKKLQVKFNEQSKTAVWRRMAWGSLPKYDSNGIAQGGLPGREIWAGLDMPIYLIAGAADTITKPEELQKIAGFLGKSGVQQTGNAGDDSGALPDAAAPVDTNVVNSPGGRSDERKSRTDSANSGSTLVEEFEVFPTKTLSHPQVADSNDNSKPCKVLKTSILPPPASHALIYTSTTSRTLAGLISDFLQSHIDRRLSLGWQLQHLTTEGKWDVKNLAKWQATAPVSAPIAGVFRAMKTLREKDDTHCPEIFVKNWKGQIAVIVDVSHESPVYDPSGLEKGGIGYHKFPTVSKIPPTVDEVRDFITLIDSLLAERDLSSTVDDDDQHPLIGVHCHYGFNRTGFFIACYLIEKKGYSVQEAIDEFKRQRPLGIKHAHFIDTLFVRYCIGLRRVPTF